MMLGRRGVITQAFLLFENYLLFVLIWSYYLVIVTVFCDYFKYSIKMPVTFKSHSRLKVTKGCVMNLRKSQGTSLSIESAI